jgi:two-component system sensor histidine kinase/response regulator
LTSLASETSSHAVINFEVRDTGIGIDPKVQPRLFQAFSQADGSNTRKYGGTGLGLVICKKLVEMMNGQVKFSSKLGEGSSFSFTAEFQKQNSLQPVAFSRSLPARRILIVDDNPTSRQILEQFASEWSMVSTSASSGSEALKHLEIFADNDPYDLAIIDLRMPDMDGIQLAQTIRKNPALASMHLILLTALGDSLESREMEQAGIEACVTKPLKRSRLFDGVFQVLSGEASPTPQKRKALTGVVRLVANPTGKPARILLAEDNVINQKVAVKMLLGIGYAADVAGNGLEALAALKRKPYDLVLMDCQMPELDGYETTRRIRALKEFAALKIVALTANSMSGENKKCLEVGMDDYLSKPVRLEALRDILIRWMPSDNHL